jgi:hypothetical protein
MTVDYAVQYHYNIIHFVSENPILSNSPFQHVKGNHSVQGQGERPCIVNFFSVSMLVR